MIVEPIAGDRPEDNMNPVGRLYYNASTMICVPTSLDQEVGEGLGAQAGEAKLTEVIREGGFARIRRATAGPFNMVLESKLPCEVTVQASVLFEAGEPTPKLPT
jgi:hypothetical protein